MLALMLLTQFHWNVKVSHAELSFHQRLVSSIHVELDGKDLEGRRSHGKLGIAIDIKDESGARYQEHGAIDLSKLDENVKDANIDYAQLAFFTPGEYQAAVTIVDAITGERDTNQSSLKVASAGGDWPGLPSVEFFPSSISPESWYLPSVLGHVKWADEVQSPARMNVILNLSPASRHGSSELEALLPSLKVLSQSDAAAITEYVELLDISRRKAVFEQDDVHGLDWPRLKASLGESNTGSIDLHSLSDRHEDAQFFVSEVRRLLRASAADKPCVLVVLTKPIAFDSGEDLDKISLEALPPCQVVYLRYHSPPVRPVGPAMGGRGGGRRSRMGGGGPMMGNPYQQEVADQLASTLKPLSPKVIDVVTPQQVARALELIAEELQGHDKWRH